MDLFSDMRGHRQPAPLARHYDAMTFDFLSMLWRRRLLIAAVTDDLIGKGVKAGDLIKHVVPAIDGRGGGKPNLAQAGGTKPEGITEALSSAVA